MNHCIGMLWPAARTKALTFSYDDGVLQDIRLMQIMREAGVRGTFNLNSGMFGQEDALTREGRRVEHGHVAAADIARAYEGFEVAVHTVTHPSLATVPSAQAAFEVLEDRRRIERLVGYPVRGMAYPNGSYDERVIRVLATCGVAYARAVQTTGRFDLPGRALAWECSCHHWGLEPLVDPFLAAGEAGERAKLLSVWGHAYEFDQRDDWHVIERQIKTLGGRPEIWYATNIEVFDYIAAWNALQMTVEADVLVNRSATALYARADGRDIEIPAGGTVRLS